MSGGIGPVDIEFAMQSFDVEASIARIKAQISSVGTTAQQNAKSTGSAFNDMGKMLAAYLTAQQLTSFAGNVAAARGEMQQLSISLEAMLKSKSKSDQLIADSVALAAKTPFTLQDVGAGTKSLIAYQFAQKDVIKTLTMLGDVASGTSTPLNELVYLYGTSKTQGRLFTKDIMQFAGRGIPIIAELAKQFNVSNAQVMKLVESGKVGFPQLQKAFESMTSSTGMFGGLMEKNSKSITGQLSNLKDAWFQAMNDMGKDNEGLISGVISGTGSLVAHWREVADIIGIVVATYGAYKAATMVVAIMNEVNAAGSLATALKQTAVAQELLNVAQKASPAGMVLVGITALIGAYVAWERHSKRASEGQEAINKAMAEESVKVTSIFETAKKATAGTKDRADAIKIINDRYGNYLTNLLTEKSSLEEIEAAQKRVTQAMMADAGAKAVKTQLDKILTEYTSTFNKAMDDYINEFSKKYGTDRAGEITTAFQEAIDKAAKNPTGNMDKSVMQGSLEVYNNYLKGTSDFWAFKDDFEKAVKSKANLDPELAKLQSQASSFQKLLDFNKKTGGNGGGNAAPEVDKDAFTKALEERKKQYELYYKWVSSMGKDAADIQFETLIKGGNSYREYLLKEIDNNENSTGQVFVLKSALADVDQIKKPFDAFKDEVKSTKDSAADLTDYISYLNKEIAKLNGKESEQDKQKLGFLNEEKVKATNDELAKTIETFDELLKKTQDFNNQKVDVETKFAADFALLEKRKTSIGEEEYTKRLELLKKNKSKELDAITDAAFEETDLYKKLTAYIDNEDVKQLRQHKVYLEQALASDLTTNEKKKEYAIELAELKKELNSRDAEFLGSMLNGVSQLGSAFSKLGGGVGEFASSLSSAASTANDLMNAIASGSKAGAIGTVFTMTGNIISNIVSQIQKEKKEAAEYYQSVIAQQNQYNLLLNEEIRLSSEKNKNIFTTDYQAVISSAFAAMADAQAKYKESISKLENDGLAKVTYQKYTKVLGIKIKLGTESGLEPLLEVYKDLIDKNGELNTSLAQTLVDQNSIDDATKETLKTAIEWQKSYEEAKKQISSTMQALVGGLGSDLENALRTAFENGTDAGVAMFAAINDALGNYISKMAYAAAFNNDLTALQKDTEVSLSLAGDQNLTDDFARFYAKVAGDKEIYNQIMRAAQEGGSAAGLELFKKTTEDSSGGGNSLSGAVKGVTQETASVLAGQINALRINQAQGITIMNSQLMQLSKIEVNTAVLHKIYEQMKSDTLRSKGL